LVSSASAFAWHFTPTARRGYAILKKVARWHTLRANPLLFFEQQRKRCQSVKKTFHQFGSNDLLYVFSVQHQVILLERHTPLLLYGDYGFGEISHSHRLKKECGVALREVARPMHSHWSAWLDLSF